MRGLALVILLGAAIPGTGWSQTEFGRPWGPRASLLFGGKPSQDIRLVLGDTDRPQVGPTYWKEGAIGVSVGALIGGQFPKSEASRSPPDSIRLGL